ncbi:acyl-CoA dehydrogenase family protein [Pseudonocardia kunmingensis]|uniref:acyl-CoA dehydrogenase family protein n=1 Tax=Pseudonocardia kunmingensis TaxID=630975 RepID=UPI001B878760|nr:acyl-CoA dehydrogenase family protein [Pseudonocardia kunmingensis]
MESFRLRARAWLAENMPKIDPDYVPPPPGDDDEEWVKARELQKKLYAGGFAGICFPTEYGGLGLTPPHQEAFTEESLPYQMPLALNVPTFSICAPTIMDMGSEEQKRDRIGAAIRGDEILVQFLSEPSGGSDLAGLITRAERDGDTWVITGAKTWSTSAYAADWALCLARTDWDAPKHRGLTMFLMPTTASGITMNRIRQVNGSTEFCEEFFDNVVLPASAVVGEVNNGWAVASRQLFYERTAVGGGSPYVSGRGDRIATTPRSNPIEIARATGRTGDPAVREKVGGFLTTQKVQEQLVERVTRAIQGGQLPPPAASFMRLFHAEADWERDDVSVQIAGAMGTTGAAAAPGMGGVVGVNYLMRQGSSLGGGSTEMSRNIISERVLGMPREFAADRDVPFSQVKRARN